MKIIDLSVAIENDVPADPPHMMPKITYFSHMMDAGLKAIQRYFPTVTREDLPDGEAWANETVTLTPHSGTHMDAPWHYHSTMEGGKPSWTIDEVPLEWCMGGGIMVDFFDKPDGYVCTSRDFIEYFDLVGYTPQPGNILLLRTRASSRWGQADYMVSGCGVGREATIWLCDQGIRCVGTDAWSWDAPLSLVSKRFEETKDPSIIWEGHKAGKDRAYLQMEKLTNLEKLPPFGFQVLALPIKIKGASAGWVRAVALLED